MRTLSSALLNAIAPSFLAAFLAILAWSKSCVLEEQFCYGSTASNVLEFSTAIGLVTCLFATLVYAVTHAIKSASKTKKPNSGTGTFLFSSIFGVLSGSFWFMALSV